MTSGAKKALTIARNESHKLKHSVIGTEHILIGLRSEDSGFAAAALRQSRVKVEDIKGVILNAAKALPNPPALGRIPFSDMAKKALDAAFNEAAEMRHNYIGTEHILLGILETNETNASKILIQLGHNIDSIKQEIYEISGEAVVKSEVEEEEEVGSQASVEKRGGKKTKALAQYGRDLTKLAEEGKLDPVIGREDEIERITMILGRRTKNNPVLLGEPGVGKTAIIEGIAQRIVNGDAPESILNHRLVALDLTSMVAGTKYRGQFEERIKAVMQEASNTNIILFIDELHTLVGAGSAEGAIDAANVLKPALSRGEIRCCGATTLDEYRKYIEKDGALNRRFQKVIIDPPSIEDTITIINGLKHKYEEHHRVIYSKESIESAVILADRYITNRFLPDKAIDVMDEAGARQVMDLYRPRGLRAAEKKLELLQLDKAEAVIGQKFELAAKLRDDIIEATETVDSLKIQWKSDKSQKKHHVISKELVAQTVAKITGIPIANLTASESDKMLVLESHLDKTVIGQAKAKTAISKALRRTRAGLGDPKRPMGCFLFLGPTGVGKTLLVKALAEVMFDREDALISFDMSEYMEKHSVSKLLGAPPGYVGHEAGGQLTEAVRRKPYSIVLFDEIEKAHSDVYNSLLQVMEEGHLTDSSGRKVDFKHAMIIFTSNVGSDIIKNKAPLGFGASGSEDPAKQMEEQLEGAISKAFKPEFINRLDSRIYFTQLQKEEVSQILDLELDKIRDRLKGKDLDFALSENAREFILAKGWNPDFGARPLRRAVENYIEDLLAEEILRGNLETGSTVTIDREDDSDFLFLV